MAEETEAGGKKKNRPSGLWILLVILMIVSGGSLGYLAWNYYRGSRWGNAGIHEAAKPDEGPQGNPTAETRGEVKSTLNLEPFLVNLADPQSVRFVKVTFQLGLTEDKEEFMKNPIAVAATRDAIITLLSSKTSDQILTVKGKEDLRREVRDRVNGAVTGSRARVQDVYIVELVVQL